MWLAGKASQGWEVQSMAVCEEEHVGYVCKRCFEWWMDRMVVSAKRSLMLVVAYPQK